MFSKKSSVNPTGAPILIAVITLLIVLYVLMLPPQERANLLGDQPTTVTLPGTPDSRVNYPEQKIRYTGKKTLLLEVPGNIDYTALNELEIPLNSFMLYKTISAQVLEEFNPFYIKNSIGDKVFKNLTFQIRNLQNTENVILSFKTKKNKGILKIKLNDETIFEYDIDTISPPPIKLKKSLLKDRNVLQFSVSDVGFKFWETNEYSFEDIKIIGDVADTSRQESQNTFFISEEQGTKIERAILKFLPDCRSKEVGRLTIKLNDRIVFSAVPDCGNQNFVEFAPNMIIIGKNRIDFNTEAGSYLVDLIKLKLEFKDNQIPVYYFDVDPELFNLKFEDVEPECGKIDGKCPKFCDADSDYDCCMKEYTTPFWCVAKTHNEDDRCVGAVTTANFDRCITNYVNKNGEVSDVGKNKCGDNKDGKCPIGCSIYYDKDCCFNQQGDQFWCESMPSNGLDYRCLNSVSLGLCDVCSTGYIGESKTPICSPSKQVYESYSLKSDYGVVLNMKFVDDYKKKEADLYINGHLIRLQTNGALYQRDISNLVEPGSNSLEIVPFSQLNIRELKIDVVQ